MTNRLSGLNTVVEGDAQSILILFEKHDDYASHPLYRDACMVRSFANFSVQHIWSKENMCVKL